MRELDGRRMRDRVRGLAAIRRRLRAVQIALARFARCRATTPREQPEAGRLFDALAALLDTPVSAGESVGYENAGDPGDPRQKRVNGGAQ